VSAATPEMAELLQWHCVEAGLLDEPPLDGRLVNEGTKGQDA
jgi:hypothetical protein